MAVRATHGVNVRRDFTLAIACLSSLCRVSYRAPKATVTMSGWAFQGSGLNFVIEVGAGSSILAERPRGATTTPTRRESAISKTAVIDPWAALHASVFLKMLAAAHYSARSAVVGSTREARQAGTPVATSATSAMTTDTVAMVTVSIGATP